MCLVFVCDEDERIVGQKHAPGNCPYCGGLIQAMDIESQWRLCFLPLYYKTKHVRQIWKNPESPVISIGKLVLSPIFKFTLYLYYIVVSDRYRKAFLSSMFISLTFMCV
ncbi:hypothetical protein Ccrd_002760 [Cynara cardunculus var. scolymus]|uniref:Uncharacterized protein n=1 Tax=Cynara cardunculus var. scolymus TaxID=59895 RepID=A0A118JWZ6_CYNCS|nr:hypothetical protein Ccrd_002760 [Cynara cardunculus var. scolymus]